MPELVVDVDAPVTVRGDPTLLRHCPMTNLVDNAIRHGQAGGSGTGAVAVRARGGWASAEVIDADPASPAPNPTALSGTGGGAGLGLPLVEWVARQHGSRVEARRAGR